MAGVPIEAIWRTIALCASVASNTITCSASPPTTMFGLCVATIICRCLDRKEEAIAEGKRAIELTPESKDAFDGPQFTVTLAQIYALTGERNEALQLLDGSLNTPNGITIPFLKLDPVWDPLRSDPRF